MPPASWDDTQTQNPHQAVHGCKYPTQAFYPNDPGKGGCFFVVVVVVLFLLLLKKLESEEFQTF